MPPNIPAESGVLPLMIAAEWQFARSGTGIGNISPATETPMLEPGAGTPDDVDDAVLAAGRASEGWRSTSPDVRQRTLLSLAEVLETNSELLARLDASDGGMPIRVARRDVAKGISMLRYFAHLATEVRGQTYPRDAASLVYSQREPYGVVGVITPFNHPAMFAISKLAAPLAAGNAVVLKPPAQASLSSIAFAEFCRQTLPRGLVNVVTGAGATVGAALAAHPGVSRISFTGSVDVGREVLRLAAARIVRCSMELGGKNAAIIYSDMPIDRAVIGAIAGMSLSVCGQSCQSATRVFVHRSRYAEFQQKLASALQRVTIGDPLSEETEMGPLISSEQLRRVMSYVASGAHEGATLLTGGKRPPGLKRGYFIEPTVFADVEPSMKIAREEIFGPVMSVLPWDDEDEMLATVNDSSYGLTASVWTQRLDAMQVVRKIDAGYVYINKHGGALVGVPFGGWKQSGMGVEHSEESLFDFTQIKLVEAALG